MITLGNDIHVDNARIIDDETTMVGVQISARRADQDLDARNFHWHGDVPHRRDFGPVLSDAAESFRAWFNREELGTLIDCDVAWSRMRSQLVDQIAAVCRRPDQHAGTDKGFELPPIK